MIEFIAVSWGAVLSHVVAFGAGALIGKPMFEWLRTFLPWNK